jgi:hypothetical protein
LCKQVPKSNNGETCLPAGRFHHFASRYFATCTGGIDQNKIPFSVDYLHLSVLLLNEMKKHHEQLGKYQEEIRELKRDRDRMQESLEKLMSRLEALERQNQGLTKK